MDSEGINYQSLGFDNYTALHQVAGCSLELTLAILDKSPKSINLKGDDGKTPIFNACYSNKLDIAKALKENKADLTIISNRGESCLHIASECGSIDIIKWLLTFDEVKKLIDKVD